MAAKQYFAIFIVCHMILQTSFADLVIKKKKYFYYH